MKSIASFGLRLLVATVMLSAPVAAPEANAQDRAVENLAQFARLFGYVRFFCPSDEAAEIDWNTFAVAGAEATRDAGNEEALRDALRELFEPIAPGLVVSIDMEKAKAEQVAADTNGGRVTYWQHVGVRLSEQSNIYQSRRVIRKEGQGQRAPLFPRAQAAPSIFEATLAPNLAIQLPLVLAVSAEGRTSGGKPIQLDALKGRLAKVVLKNLKPTDWRLRVAGVITAWNVFQHFHPYLDGIGVKWDDALRPALRRALADRTREDYYATLSELVAKLQDGHGYVSGASPSGGLPIRVELIEEQIVITAVEGNALLHKGDVISRIDDKPAMDLLRERERYVSGSPQLRRHRALNQFGEGPIDSVARVELLRDGAIERVEVNRLRDRRNFFFNPIAEFEFPAIAEVQPGIFHINLSTLDVTTLTKKLPELAGARGVIFDFRSDGRPGPMDAQERIMPHQHIIPHLIDQTVKVSPMRVPQVTLPDRAGWSYHESAWPVEPQAPRLKGRIAFINVPSVVSYGETCMAIIADYHLATLVGEPTAGCNGNANFIVLPGGFRIMWTGMEVIKHDRSPFYLTGFVPDYPVSRTIKAVKEGRDEFLGKAISVIEQAANQSK